MHQVVTAQLAARRAGTQSTKTRAEVPGGGASRGARRAPAAPARARSGPPSGRRRRGPRPQAPQLRQRTPKKMIRLALRSALSDRAADGKVLVVDPGAWRPPPPRTPSPRSPRSGVEGRAPGRAEAPRTTRCGSRSNLPDVQTHLIEAELNAYDVLVNDWVVFTKEARCPGGGPASGGDRG